MNIRVIVSLAFTALVIPADAHAVDKPVLTDADKSLAGFPNLKLQVKTVVGHLGVFTPAKVGDTIELDLPKLLKSKDKESLILKFVTGDPRRKHAIAYLPARPHVVRINRYGNGIFQSLRLSGRSGREKVNVDVLHIRAWRKRPASVRVILTYEIRGITGAIFVLEGTADGAFPRKFQKTK